MPRFNNIDGIKVQFTPEEEAARDAEEAAREAEKPARWMVVFRENRNTLLTESDWTQGSDTPLNDGAKSEWAVYRQLLRDLPQNIADPGPDPTWPTPPG